jgi:cobalamin transport system substrate-binding protein
VVAVVLASAAGCKRQPPAADPGAPARIVTLTPSATEVVAALGATDRLVGVDDYSTYPAAAARLPKVGTFLQPDLEAVMQLRPTVVIADDVQGPFAARLRDAGIAAIDCPMHTLEDVKASLRTVGARLGRADAAGRAVAAIDRAIDEARARHTPGAAPRPRVLAVIDHEAGGLGGLIAAGPGTWLDELLAIEGAENALAGTGVRYPKISLEDVLRARPTVIVDAAYAADPATEARAWAPAADVPAVAAGRIAVAKEPYLLAPSPRVADALATLDGILYPTAAPAATAPTTAPARPAP